MREVLLKSICRPKQWKTISTKDLKGEGYPVYGANGKIGFYNAYTHEHPTILITCRGATCGSINISEPKSYVNGNAMALDNLSDEVHLYYLAHYLRFRKLDDVISGSAQPQITGQGLSSIQIPLPPLEQQKKIAAILDAADTYRQLTKALIAKYDELTQSMFLDMFGDYLNSELKPLGDVVKFSQGQQFGLEFQSSVPKEGYHRFLRIVDYTQGDELRYVPNDCNKNYVFKDDIVIVRYGASAGFVGTNKEGVLANNLFKVNYDRKVFHQYFLFYIFQNERFKLFVEKEAFGAAMPALSFKVMERFEIPVPPINLQNQFAERVQAIEQQKAQAQASLEKAEELFNSLLQKAFKGELV